MQIGNNTSFFIKTATSSVASCMVLGPQIGAVIAIANVIFSHYYEEIHNTQWFKFDHAAKHIRISIQTFPRMFFTNTVLGVSMVFFSSFLYPINSISLVNQRICDVFWRTVVLSSFFEEVFFRGILQERICHIQSFLGSKIRKDYQKFITIITQAVLFVLKCIQNVHRLIEIPITFITGCTLGYLKDKTGDLWMPISFRIILNSVILARVALFGG